MDREILLEHLEEAQRHVTKGERLLKHQRSIIEDLCRHRHRHSERVIDEAERLLHTFEEVQRMHIADVVRLQGELGTPT